MGTTSMVVCPHCSQSFTATHSNTTNGSTSATCPHCKKSCRLEFKNSNLDSVKKS